MYQLLRISMVFFFIFLLFNCKTLQYQFIDDFDINKNINLLNRIKNQRLFSENGSFNGLFIEKGKNYYFEIKYDLVNDYYELKFYSPLKKELIFNAELMKNDTVYNYFKNDFFSVKIGKILTYFQYMLNTIPKEYRFYQTIDDFIVAVDLQKNYFKYDNDLLVKKENKNLAVRYYYDENRNLNRIEIEDQLKFYSLTLNEE